MKLTTERGTPIFINPNHVVTIEPAMDDKGRAIVGITAVIISLFPSGPGQWPTVRVRGSFDEVVSQLFDVEVTPRSSALFRAPETPGPEAV